MSSTAAKIKEVLNETPLLTKTELFDKAGLFGTESDVVFKFMIGNGAICKVGEKRGTRYYLKEQNIDELLAEKQEQEQQAEEEKPKEPIVKRQKASEEEISDNINKAVVSVRKFGEDGRVFSFDELSENLPDIQSSILRSAIHNLLDDEVLFETQAKRGKRYCFDEEKILDLEDNKRIDDIVNIADKIYPFFETQKKGVTVSSIVENFKDVKKYLIYLALQHLEDNKKIERFGMGRGTTYSLAGEGSVEKVGSFTIDQINSVKDRVYKVVLDKRVVRPLILETEMDIDRKLLDAALDALVASEQLKYHGERRGKVVAVLSADDLEIEKAREEQVSLASEICDDLSRIVCSGYNFAAVQKDGVIFSRRTPSFDPSNKRILNESKTYGEFLTYMKGLINATDADLNEDARA